MCIIIMIRGMQLGGNSQNCSVSVIIGSMQIWKAKIVCLSLSVKCYKYKDL